MQAQPTTFESVPRYYRLPRAVHREQLRDAVLELLAAGERVSVLRLRQCGIRGGTAQLIALRQELVATGELPPEAAARIYAPQKHPPGRSVERGACGVERDKSTPHDPRPKPHDVKAVGGQGRRTKDQGPDGLRRRRSRRLVREYNSAVRHVFGRARAREIGAAP
jgi:hypothetical protein